MITTMLATETISTLVSLDVTGDEAFIEMGDNPHYSKPVQVSALAIAYTVATSSDSASTASAVTGITYTVTGQDYSTISVHPDFLDNPEAWPAWVRTLVDRFRPTPTRRTPDNCPQCAAPAALTGGHIPKHRDGCPAEC